MEPLSRSLSLSLSKIDVHHEKREDIQIHLFHGIDMIIRSTIHNPLLFHIITMSDSLSLASESSIMRQYIKITFVI